MATVFWDSQGVLLVDFMERGTVGHNQLGPILRDPRKAQEGYPKSPKGQTDQRSLATPQQRMGAHFKQNHGPDHKIWLG